MGVRPRSAGTPVRRLPVPRGGRAFEIVEVLVQPANHLATRDHLTRHVWPGAIVGENTLHVHISAVHKALVVLAPVYGRFTRDGGPVHGPHRAGLDAADLTFTRPIRGGAGPRIFPRGARREAAGPGQLRRLETSVPGGSDLSRPRRLAEKPDADDRTKWTRPDWRWPRNLNADRWPPRSCDSMNGVPTRKTNRAGQWQ